MEILSDPSLRRSGVSAVHVSVHVDGEAEAWVTVYPDFVTVQIHQQASAVSVFVQNVAQADDLIRLLQMARTGLVDIAESAALADCDADDDLTLILPGRYTLGGRSTDDDD